MKKVLLCVFLAFLACGYVCSIELDHFGVRGRQEDGSFYISLYDKYEKNGVVLSLLPVSNKSSLIAQLVIKDNWGFSLMAPEGSIIEDNSKYTDFVVALMDTEMQELAFATCRLDHETDIEIIRFDQALSGAESFVTTIIESLILYQELELTVSAISITNQDFEVGTTRKLNYNVAIDSKELGDAYWDYFLWLYGKSGWQI